MPSTTHPIGQVVSPHFVQDGPERPAFPPSDNPSRFYDDLSDNKAAIRAITAQACEGTRAVTPSFIGFTGVSGFARSSSEESNYGGIIDRLERAASELSRHGPAAHEPVEMGSFRLSKTSNGGLRLEVTDPRYMSVMTPGEYPSLDLLIQKTAQRCRQCRQTIELPGNWVDSSRELVSQAIAKFDTGFYLKPNLYHGEGRGIIRVTPRDRGAGWLIETDDARAQHFLRQSAPRDRVFSPTIAERVAGFIFDGHRPTTCYLRSNDELLKTLARYCSDDCLESTWVAEAILPVKTVRAWHRQADLKIEFRVITHKPGLPSAENDDRTVQSAIAKVSGASVTGNVSQGGFIVKTHDAIRALVQSRTPGIRGMTELQEIADMRRELMDTAVTVQSRFDRIVRDHMAKAGIDDEQHIRLAQKVPCAIDLAPIEGEGVPWGIVEIQNHFSKPGRIDTLTMPRPQRSLLNLLDWARSLSS